MSPTDEQIQQAAMVCFEATRAWNIALGDRSGRSWWASEEWERAAAVAGVKARLECPPPAVEGHPADRLFTAVVAALLAPRETLPIPPAWPPALVEAVRRQWEQIDARPHVLLSVPVLNSEEIAGFARRWKEAMDRPGAVPAVIMVPDNDPGILQRIDAMIRAEATAEVPAAS